ncbi:MAG: 30S ribosomal protein S8 [Acidiferrobacterales bacterium]
MMTDPISDMLTRLRNAQQGEKVSALIPSSNTKRAIAQVLQEEGYIERFEERALDGKPVLEVFLKYYAGRPVIESIQRVSRPGRRQYRGCDELPKIAGGLGMAIISTSRGIMSDRSARRAGVGGEVLCFVS